MGTKNNPGKSAYGHEMSTLDEHEMSARAMVIGVNEGLITLSFRGPNGRETRLLTAEEARMVAALLLAAADEIPR